MKNGTDVAGVSRVICPPYVCLAVVADALAGSDVAVGAQDVHAETKGAYTGEISAATREPWNQVSTLAGISFHSLKPDIRNL